MLNRSPPKKILLIGFSCRAAAQAAVADGFEVSVVDRCGDRDTRALASEFVLAPDAGTIQDWIRILSPLAKSCDDYLLAGGTEHDTALRTAIDWIGFRQGRSQTQNIHFLAAMRTFENWKRWGANAKLPLPMSFKLQQNPSLNWNELSQRSESFLLKRTQSSGGLGVSILDRETLLESLSSTDDIVIQEQVEGDCFGISFLSSSFGATAIGCCRSLTRHSFVAPPSSDDDLSDQNVATSSQSSFRFEGSTHPWGPFVYAGSEGPTSLSTSEWEKLDYFANSIHTEIPWLGLWQADFVRDQHNNWHLLEINPRWTASMELLATTYANGLVAIHFQLAHQRIIASEWMAMVERFQILRSSIQVLLQKRVLYAPIHFSLTNRMAEHWWDRRWTNQQALRPGRYYCDIPNDLGDIPFGYPVCSQIDVE